MVEISATGAADVLLGLEGDRWAVVGASESSTAVLAAPTRDFRSLDRDHHQAAADALRWLSLRELRPPR